VSLQTALAEAVARADDAVNQRQTEALEQERQVTSELRETLDRLRTESSLTEDRLRAEAAGLQRQLENEQTSFKAMKDEMTAEVNVFTFS